MSWWGDDARTETYQQAIQAFEAKLQYITVETIYGTTADEDQTADVMQVDWTWPGQNADQFVDLNGYSDVIGAVQPECAGCLHSGWRFAGRANVGDRPHFLLEHLHF